MNLLIAGGGTGGHLFPGIALAEAMRERDVNVRITFMGTDRGLEKNIIPELGYDLVTLPVGGIMGLGLKRGLSRAVGMILAVVRASGMLRKLAPDLVVGVGGYASVPAVLAAAIRKVPRCIIEQNVVPGRANRFLARFVPRIYLGFPIEEPVFPPGTTVVTGNPIRKEALSHEDVPVDSGEGITLLILGGSQGASQLNGLAMEMVPALLRQFSGLNVIHQTGSTHEARVREYYDREGVEVEVVPFIAEMGAYYSRSDLVLSRSGAMSVSELAAAGLPAILIPYPHAIQDHQRANGRWLEKHGGAILVDPEDATPELLKSALEHLLANPERLREMSDASRRVGTRDAARRIIEEEMKRLEASRGSEKTEGQGEGERGRGGEESHG